MSAPDAGVSGLRHRVVRASAPLLASLSQLPRFVLTAVFAVLILLGLFGPRWVATGCLAVIVLVLGWLVVLLGTSGGRTRVALRIGSFVVLLVVLVARAAGAGAGL